jgi:hypothetical protein
MVVGNNPEGDGTVLSFHQSTLQTAMKKLSGNLSLDIIEQVTGFKYLRYRISEYKSDLEGKLQTYNKINGAIRRHFGKQMNKETKLRIYNITTKAVLKFGSEAWVLKKREKQRLEAAQMKFLRHLLAITKLD